MSRRSLQHTIARPGGNANAFCEPKTSASGAILLIFRSTAPTDVTPSTKMRASLSALMASHISVGWFITPVDDSLDMKVTASMSFISLPLTCSGLMPLPHSTSILSTSFPFAVPMPCHLSPNEPFDIPVIFRLTPQRTQASRNPVAEAGARNICMSVSSALCSFSTMPFCRLE